MKSLIFDFDGVLGNTFEVSAEFIAKQAGISVQRAKNILIKEGMQNKKDKLFYRLLKNWYYKKILNFYKQKKSLLFEERIREIEEIWSSHPKAILTRSDGRVCRELLGNYQNMFEFIIGREVAQTKLVGLKTINFSSRFKLENCIFFTDSVGDFKEISKILKPEQIYGVSWGFQSREILATVFKPEQIIDSFNEVNFIQ